MKRADLEHILRAASAITKQTRFLVVGSQAIVGVVPEPSGALGMSMEADLCPIDDPKVTDLIDGSIGESSPFHETFGYYAQGVASETAVLPKGWEGRVNRVIDPISRAEGLCIDPGDLAAWKLVAWREKDRQFIEALLSQRLIDVETLRTRVGELPGDRLATYGLDHGRLLARVGRLQTR
jgi:hypothetical protein